MENLRIMIIGGNFNNMGGNPSTIVHKMGKCFGEYYENVTVYNGGFPGELRNVILPQVKDADIVVWMPNVPNDEPKMRDVKAVNPKAILVSSKRNDNNKYSFAELINRALQQKSNLVLEFSKQEGGFFHTRVFDPLGTVHYDGDELEPMIQSVIRRSYVLANMTRSPSVQASGDIPPVEDRPEFFEFARNCSDVFHNLIQPEEGVTRFLGNMSFRCQNGFPSFRGENGLIYVSRRNVDKRDINAESFVPTYIDKDGTTFYYGDHKPSVDTPIQQRLYELFPNMNYMMHAHCYIDYPGTVTTSNPIPCGALEEVHEIVGAVLFGNANENSLITVNLAGHGCLIMAESIEDIQKIGHEHFVARPMPEHVNDLPMSSIEQANNHEDKGDEF